MAIDAQETEKLMTALRYAAGSIADNRSIRDLELSLTRVVHSAVETVPGASGGGISRTDEGTVRSSHATSEQIHDLDERQSQIGQGPCITAANDPPAAGVVLAVDLAGADARRWPRFAPVAVEAGYRSLLSVHLSFDGRRRSALNLYAHEPGAYDASAQLTAGMFGIQAAMLLYGADHAAHLTNAVQTRDVIGQAKGILMERFTVDDDEAFQMLVNSSQDTNMKLVAVAAWVADETKARRRRARAEPDHG